MISKILAFLTVSFFLSSQALAGICLMDCHSSNPSQIEKMDASSSTNTASDNCHSKKTDAPKKKQSSGHDCNSDGCLQGVSLQASLGIFDLQQLVSNGPNILSSHNVFGLKLGWTGQKLHTIPIGARPPSVPINIFLQRFLI